MTTEKTAQAPARRWGKLERPGTRRRLIRELAQGVKGIRELAREYDVSDSSIREFRDRHLDEIHETIRDLDDEFSGLWIAQKLNRIAELQELYEGDEDIDRVKLRVDILRKAAEELGQIPNRTTITMNQPIEVRLIGIDTEQL